MEDSVAYGLIAGVFMLGVPLWHGIRECKRGRVAEIQVLRWWLTCGLMVFVTFTSAIFCGMVGFVLADFSVIKPSPVTTECRILTNSVDLRSAKVCELGLFNYKAKHVMQPCGRSRYRCRYDYYWASVFKVEFRSHTSGRLIQAAAEAPKEALPLDCRPSFSSAWRTKDKFKVNGTYHCKYTPGKSKVDIVGDNFFNCSAKDPSIFELIRRIAIFQDSNLLIFEGGIVLKFENNGFIIRFWQSDHSLLSQKRYVGRAFWKVVESLLVAISYSLLVTGFAKAVRELRFILHGSPDSSESKIDAVFFEARLQLTCLFISSLFVVLWLGDHHEWFSRLFDLLVRANFQKVLKIS